MSVATPAMTVAEFLDWAKAHDGRWELVEGTARTMAPAAPRHGVIGAQLTRLLVNHLTDLRHRCSLVIEPGVQPRVRADINVRIPDIAVACAPIGDEDRLLREPLVLIEILSPSNPKDTWANVWAYTTIPSVTEILVVHTTVVRFDLLRRGEDGEWPDNPIVLGSDDVLWLDSIGFAAPLAAFYRTARIGCDERPAASRESPPC